MAFHNLCQKMDLDSIKAKFSNLPALPPMPHIKLPKSMPKLKSRKIFRTSRENVNPDDSPKSKEQNFKDPRIQSLPPMPPAPGFVKHTPMRISTISSLMFEDSPENSTYRSADSIDEDYQLPGHHYRRSSAFDMRAISPIRTSLGGPQRNNPTTSASTNSQIRMSFTEKLHKSYKDLSEFRVKNLFAKKTILRKDSIRVEHYVERYREDLVHEAREQEFRDRTIAENYSFRFKISRQNPDHSTSVTPEDSPKSEPIIRPQLRTVGEHSGDESGMEATPPPRKPGIASTRFAKVRKPPLRFSSSEQEDDIYEKSTSMSKLEPIPSSLWSSKVEQNKTEIREGKSEEKVEQQTPKNKFNYKERMRRFASFKSTQEDSDQQETPAEDIKGNNKMLSKIKNFGKRSGQPEKSVTEKRQRNENSPQSSEDEEFPLRKQPEENPASPTARALTAIKQNFKRFHQSLKSKQQPNMTDESADEATSTNQRESIKGVSKTEKFTARLRRFRSRDVSVDNLDENEDVEDEAANHSTDQQSPLRKAFNNKFESLKKSIKLKSSKISTNNEPGDDHQSSSPENEKSIKHRRSETLIKKLKHIRARKNPDSKEDLDVNTDAEMGETDEAAPKAKGNKFTEARQRTFKKVNEKMQQLKFFHKSQEQPNEPQVATKAKRKSYHSEEEDWDESPEHEFEETNNARPTITRRDFAKAKANSSEQEEPEEEAEEMVPDEHPSIDMSTARAAWSTKSIYSDSLDSDADGNEFPRVLIHQDNSDGYESTLIIAVTQPAVILGRAGPRITEIIPENPPRDLVRPEKPQRPAPPAKKEEWIPNKKIIADFLETTPPGGRRKRSLEMSIAPKQKAPLPTAVGSRSIDSNSNSNSDSDTWIAEYKLKENVAPRRSSQFALSKIDEKTEAWKVQIKKTVKEKNEEPTALYKTKSIDIFEKNVLKGGVLTAFEDFDEELRNEPVLKIAGSCEREISDETADDDNSSRVTKISVKNDLIATEPPPLKETKAMKTLLQYGNSRESLIANFDENDDQDSLEEDDENEQDNESDDRPPSEAPSPPPKMSPPPPPLPQRHTSLQETNKKKTEINEENLPPPLPKSKPPIITKKASTTEVAAAPTHPPPRIPERSASMARAPKPLVKTSSLRVVYSEQVKPSDVGKVNKLISRFEPTEGKTQQRPRVIPRRIQQDDSEEYSDDDEDYATMVDKLKERYANIKIESDSTPTPTNTPKMKTPEFVESPKTTPTSTNKQPLRMKREMVVPFAVTTTDEDNNTQILMQHHVDSDMKPLVDLNSNHSRPNSEYGSPLEYPSSLQGSMEAIPTIERRETGQLLQHQHQRTRRSVDRHIGRSRRSMTRDEDNFYSFDSDEENSYYSISSTGSNRYIVEL